MHHTNMNALNASEKSISQSINAIQRMTPSPPALLFRPARQCPRQGLARRTPGAFSEKGEGSRHRKRWPARATAAADVRTWRGAGRQQAGNATAQGWTGGVCPGLRTGPWRVPIWSPSDPARRRIRLIQEGGNIAKYLNGYSDCRKASHGAWRDATCSRPRYSGGTGIAGPAVLRRQSHLLSPCAAGFPAALSRRASLRARAHAPQPRPGRPAACGRPTGCAAPGPGDARSDQCRAAQSPG